VAWIGYYEYGGTEIVNAQRTEVYARNSGVGWFKPIYRNEYLGPLLEETYTSPLQDDAPWLDWRDPDTFDFFGCYPLDVGGVEDATWSATITENVGDGGVIGRVRHTTRSVTFNVALIGANECGVEAGMRWLRAALGGQACAGPASGSCQGHDLCYLKCEPTLDLAMLDRRFGFGVDGVRMDGMNPTVDMSSCLNAYLRTLRNATLLTGPTVSGKQTMTDGGCVWTATFTIVAGNPYEWGQEEPVVIGFMDPEVDVPYAGGEVPEGGMFDVDGFVQTEVTCPVEDYTPVFDPACPFVIPPPGLPNVDIACFDFPVNYIRRQFVIPKDRVPLWGEVVPMLQIRAPLYEVRSMRLRFYSDSSGAGDPNQDPCNFCGDIVFSYIPQNSTLVFDGSDRVVYLQTPGGGRRRADSLVFGSDGNPFAWPELSCGIGYVVTVDLPQTQKPPIVDLSLYSRAA